jgi:hypothetical protein
LAECDAARIPYTLTERYHQSIAQRKTKTHLASVKTEPGSKYHSKALVRYTLQKLKYSLPIVHSIFSIREVYLRLRFYWKQIAAARKVLMEEQPDILIFGCEPLSGFEVAINRIAYRQGIPSLVIPYTGRIPESFCRSYLSKPNYELNYTVSTAFNHVAAWCYPQWTYMYKGSRFLFKKAADLIALHLAGVAETMPWRESGPETICTFAMECEMECQRYLELGVPSHKLIVTGKPLHDILFQVSQESHARREALYERLGLPGQKRMILCAVPQLAEHGFLSWEESRRAIETLMASLTSVQDANVILSLHPGGMRKENYVYLEEIFNVRIADEASTYLIPLCDLFVASGSSTVKMAICSHKPVINILCWLTVKAMDIPGIVTIHNEHEINPTIQRIMNNPEEYNAARQRVIEIAPLWGVVDGQALERLIALADSLTGRR